MLSVSVRLVWLVIFHRSGDVTVNQPDGVWMWIDLQRPVRYRYITL